MFSPKFVALIALRIFPDKHLLKLNLNHWLPTHTSLVQHCSLLKTPQWAKTLSSLLTNNNPAQTLNFVAALAKYIHVCSKSRHNIFTLACISHVHIQNWAMNRCSVVPFTEFCPESIPTFNLGRSQVSNVCTKTQIQTTGYIVVSCIYCLRSRVRPFIGRSDQCAIAFAAHGLYGTPWGLWEGSRSWYLQKWLSGYCFCGFNGIGLSIVLKKSGFREN